MNLNNRATENTNNKTNTAYKSPMVVAGLGGLLVVAIALVFLVTPADNSGENELAQSGQATTTVSVPDSWRIYQNQRFGFSFWYPQNRTAFSEVDVENENLIPASATSTQLSVTQKESHVFCCEPITLSFSIKSQPDEQDIAQAEKSFVAGHEALVVRGDGGIGDVYKKVMFRLDDSEWLIVNQNGESQMLDKVLSTFRISQPVLEPKISTTTVSVPDSWEMYENNEFGFTFAYPDHLLTKKWGGGLGNKFAVYLEEDTGNKAGFDVFVLEEGHYLDCEGSRANSADNVIDNGWERRAGKYFRDICIKRNNNSLEISLVAEDKVSQEKISRILSTFKVSGQALQFEAPATAESRTGLTVQSIRDKYTEEFMSDSAFVKEIAIGKGDNQIARRQPTEFARWDHDNNGRDHLAVLNLLYESKDTDAPTGYEILLFKLGADNNIFAPQRLAEDGTVGTYGGRGDHSLQVENIQGRSGTQLHARTSETSGSMGERFIEKYFVYADGEFMSYDEPYSRE